MVAAALSATVLAVGMGAIYLPFIADKDRLRGLNEESDMTPSDKREYEKLLREMKGSGTGMRQLSQQQEQGQEVPQRRKPFSNSMWKRMDEATSSSRQGK